VTVLPQAGTLDGAQIPRDRIESFHGANCPRRFASSTRSGWSWLRWSAIKRSVLITAGGTAAYPSSVLMNCHPLQMSAGVARVVMWCAVAERRLNPLVLRRPSWRGVEIYLVGGAQAVGGRWPMQATIRARLPRSSPRQRLLASAKRLVFSQGPGIDIDRGVRRKFLSLPIVPACAWMRGRSSWPGPSTQSGAQSILITDHSALAAEVERAVGSNWKSCRCARISARTRWNISFGAIISGKESR